MSNKDGDREFNAAAEVKVNYAANRNQKKKFCKHKNVQLYDTLYSLSY